MAESWDMPEIHWIHYSSTLKSRGDHKKARSYRVNITGFGFEGKENFLVLKTAERKAIKQKQYSNVSEGCNIDYKILQCYGFLCGGSLDSTLKTFKANDALKIAKETTNCTN